MMIGTAGHIDHGKSTLVKALTGVDTDRLPEERRRGMSIELGYAFMPLDAPVTEQGNAVADDADTASRQEPRRIGFIDVPGHEKLVHTMISGATGIDFALLTVAADDGVMPQTLEHLAVLSLLGIDRGVVALTKIDRVDAAQVEAVRAQIRATLAGTSLADVPILPVSAVNGEGVDALRQLLVQTAHAMAGARPAAPGGALLASGKVPAVAREALPAAATELAPSATALAPSGAAPATSVTAPAASVAPPAASGTLPLAAEAFRLAIDRVFTLDGVGTVVTGTVHGGAVQVDELLDVVPQGPAGVRVRSLRAQDRAVAQAVRGQRCAIGLAGIERDQLDRGQWLVHPAIAQTTDRLDVELTLWRGEEKALSSGTRVHVHLGTDSVMGSVAVLGDAGPPACQTVPPQTPAAGAAQRRDSIAPGQRALVQLVLQRPVSAWWGDRLVLRDASGSRILAGGRVLDVRAPVRYRRTPERLALLQALCLPTLAARLDALLDLSPAGIDLSAWARQFGLRDANAFEPILSTVPHRRLSAHHVMRESAHAQLRAQVRAALRAFHESHPEELGPDTARLRRLAHLRIDDGLWRALLADMQEAGDLRVQGAFVHLPDHGEALAARDRLMMERVMPLLLEAGAQGAWVRDIAASLGEPVDVLRGVMARLARSGLVHQVVRDLFLDEGTTTRLAGQIRSLAGLCHTGEAAAGQPRVPADGEPAPSPRHVLTVAAFRDATGLGRKRAVQVLEFFDRIGLCRRVGDTHLVRTDSALFLAPAGAAKAGPEDGKSGPQAAS